MLDERQIRLLELLEDKISQCELCSIFPKKCLPYWTPLSKYLIIGNYPNNNEIDNEELLIGKTIWSIMDNYGFRKEEFAIINSIQCQAEASTKTLMYGYISHCESWVRKFIKILEPQKILILGNSFIDKHSIKKWSDNNTPVIQCSLLLLEKNIKRFKEL